MESQQQTDYSKYDKLCIGDAKSYWGKKDGYQRGQTPKLGAIGCYSGGKSGAGHVLFVEEIKPNGDIVTSNSAYKGTRFFLKTLKKSNNYKYSSIHKFQGFIYNPVEFTPTDVTPTVERDETKDQLKVITTELRVRTDHNTSANILGVAQKDGIYNYYETFKDDKYTWYRIADDQWIANNGKWLEIYPHKEDEKTIEELQKELDEANEEINCLTKELNEANEQLDEANKKIEELENDKGYKFVYDATNNGMYQIYLAKGETLYIK